MKKITLVLLALLLVVSCIGLAACNNNAQKILDAYLLDQDEQLVDKDFVLPAKIQDQAVTWTSDNDAVQIEKRTDDYLAKVNLGDEVTTVKLTVTLGNASKTFTVRVAALDVYYLADQYVFTKENATVYEDFTLDRTFTFAGKTANISWTVDDSYSDYLTISEDGNTCVVFPTSLNPQVRIKATFTYGDETTTVSYKLTVGLQRSALEEINYWYYNTDVSVEIKGYVVAVADPYSEQYGNVSLYVLDEEFVGGYYAYRVKTDAENGALIEPGAYVTITGTTNTNYNGLVETNAGGNLVVDTTKDKIDVTDYVYAIDQDILGNVPGAIYHQSRLVSLTNWTVKSVATTAPEAGSTDTLFTLEKGGVEVPVVVSKYLKGVYDTAEGDATWEALCALQGTVKVGDVVSVTGLLGNYNGAQIMPFSAEDVKTGGTADPADTVYPGQTAAKAIEEVNKTLTDNKVDARITKATEFTLPTTSNGVEIAYELCRDSKSVVIEEGKFTVTPGKHELSTVKVTYTVKDGETVVYTTAQFFDIESLVPTAETIMDELVTPPTELEKDYTLDENAVWTVKSGTGIEIVEGVAVLTRTDEDQQVVLTATVTYGGQTLTRDFYVTVLADPLLQYYIVELNVDSLGLPSGAYSDGTQTVQGVEFEYTEIGNYGDGIQLRVKDGKASAIKNNTAFHAGIAQIVIRLSKTKTVYDNQNAFSFKFGTSADALGGEILFSTVKDQYEYTITPDQATYTYFSMTKVIEQYSFYFESIKICFTEEYTMADADKAAAEEAALKLETTSYTEDGTAVLPLTGATYSDVTITWASDNTAVAIDGANLTVTMPAESARAVVTATIKCGETTLTKEFAVFLVVDILDAAKLLQQGEKLENVTLTGVVKSIDEAYSDQYKNVTLTITVGDTDIQCYRMKGDAAATAKVGDELVVTGSLENYKGAVQFSSGANGVFSERNAAFEGIVVPSEVTEDFELDSKATWTVKEGTAIVIEGGWARVTRTAEDQTVVLTATVTFDGEPLTRDYTVKVLSQEADKVYIPVPVTEATLGSYKLAMNHTNLGKTLYFTGAMDGYYFATSEKTTDAVDITVAAGSAAETYTLSFVDGSGATQYLYIVASGSYINVKYGTDAADWKWNATAQTYTFTVDGVDYFLGTSATATFETLSACKVEDLSSSCVAKLSTMREATDADFVAMAKEELKLAETYAMDFTLPTSKYATVVWAVTEGTAITVDGVNATVTRGEEDQTVKLTATITSGEAVDTKEFTIKVPKASDGSVPTLATSIKVGDRIVIAYAAGKTELVGFSTTSTIYGLKADYTDNPAATFVLEVVAGSEAGSFAFKTSDGAYLCWTSGNSLKTSTSVDANSSWTVTFEGGTTTIRNVADSKRILQYNTSFPRFACYTGSQKNADIFIVA